MRAALLLVNHDVARQEGAEIRLGIESLVGQRRVAGAKDQVRLALDAELLLELGPDVYLGENPVTGLLEQSASPFYGLFEGQARLARYDVASSTTGFHNDLLTTTWRACRILSGKLSLAPCTLRQHGEESLPDRIIRGIGTVRCTSRFLADLVHEPLALSPLPAQKLFAPSISSR